MKRDFYGAAFDDQQSINQLLSLPPSGREKDWEFKLTDPTRIEDMLETPSEPLSYDEKCALALITIASIEEVISFDQVNDRLVEI